MSILSSIFSMVYRALPTVVGSGRPEYYTELTDHYSSSSDQLAIVHTYVGISNCIVSFKLALCYKFQQLRPHHDSG